MSMNKFRYKTKYFLLKILFYTNYLYINLHMDYLRTNLYTDLQFFN